MPISRYTPVAKVVKSFGIEGEVIIKYSPNFEEELKKNEPVFIYFDGLPVPFIINEIQNKGESGARVKLNLINTKNLADEISGRIIFTIDNSTNQSSNKNTVDQIPESLDQFIGYLVRDYDSNQEIGSITNFFDYPNNPCFEVTRIVKKSEKTLLVPIHPHLIVDLSHQDKTIYTQLPQGLLEL